MSIHRNGNPDVRRALDALGFHPTTRPVTQKLIFMHDPLSHQAGVDATLVATDKVELANDTWVITLYVSNDVVVAYDADVVRRDDNLHVNLHEIDRLPLLFR